MIENSAQQLRVQVPSLPVFNCSSAADGTQIAVDVLDGMKNVPADKLKEVAEQLEQLKSLAIAALR